jgi:hypothetical protein
MIKRTQLVLDSDVLWRWLRLERYEGLVKLRSLV